MKIFRPFFCIMLFLGSSLARAVDAPAPEISHALLGVGDEVIEQGEPLRIVVRLNAPRSTSNKTVAIALAPASGAWSDAIAVEIAPAGGGAVLVRANAVGKPDSPVAKLDAGHVAGGLWRISAEAMQRLAPAAYVVRARLVIRSGSGWTGEVVSDEIPLRIVAASDSGDRASQRAVNRARDSLLGDRLEEAALVLDARLAQAPDDVTVLTARAEVALRAGNPMAAMICLNRASPKNGSGQPDIEREELRTRVQAALRSEAVPPANPPGWSWPPAVVLALSPESVAAAVGPAGTTAIGNVATSGTGKPPAVNPAPAGAAQAQPPIVIPSSLPTASVSASSPSLPGRSPVGSGPGAIVAGAQLSDAKIISDPTGQWAVGATAGSQYGKVQYSAARATGAPNVPVAGNSPDAWCPANRNNGTDWLEVTFAKPVRATEVRVRQSDSAGAIVKIEAIEPDGTAHLWWEGVDPRMPSAVREIMWFGVRVPASSYPVARVKISLDLASGRPGYKQIDAVQLVAAGGDK